MISVSYLTHIYTSQITGLPVLHQAKITHDAHYDTFGAFADDLTTTYRYPRRQSSKMETYGMAPTLYMPGHNTPKHGREPVWGNWREGALAADTVSVLVLDCDNAAPAAHLTLGDAAAILDGLGYAYLLYTSYSHTAAKPKFRLILPVSRDLTYEEAYDAARWFNPKLGGQLDLSIYSPGDYVYAPPHEGDIRIQAAAATVDPTVCRTDLPPMVSPGHGPKRIASAAQRSRVRALSGDLSTRPEVTVANPAVCPLSLRDRAASAYKDGSHSQSMMGVLASLWLRNRGRLTLGEMQHLQREIDAEMGGYYAAHYPRHEAERMIASVMAMPTPEPSYAPGEASELLERKLKHLKAKRR